MNDGSRQARETSVSLLVWCLALLCGPLACAQSARGDPFPARFPNLTGHFHLVQCVSILDRFHAIVHVLKPFLCNATPRRDNKNSPLGYRVVFWCVLAWLMSEGGEKLKYDGLPGSVVPSQHRSLLIRFVWCRVALGRGPPWGGGLSELVLGGRRSGCRGLGPAREVELTPVSCSTLPNLSSDPRPSLPLHCLGKTQLLASLTIGPQHIQGQSAAEILISSAQRRPLSASG